MLFRPIRGSFQDSINELRSFPSKNDLVQHIKETYSLLFLDDTMVDINLYHPKEDTRCGWKQTYLVLVHEYGPVGFSDSRE